MAMNETDIRKPETVAVIPVLRKRSHLSAHMADLRINWENLKSLKSRFLGKVIGPRRII